MKTIKISEYNKNMGILIDVQHPLDYDEHHTIDTLNIYYEKLIYNPRKYLDKNKKYYIICNKGVLSSKTVKYLEYLGYDVTMVIA